MSFLTLNTVNGGMKNKPRQPAFALAAPTAVQVNSYNPRGLILSVTTPDTNWSQIEIRWSYTNSIPPDNKPNSKLFFYGTNTGCDELREYRDPSTIPILTNPDWRRSILDSYDPTNTATKYYWLRTVSGTKTSDWFPYVFNGGWKATIRNPFFDNNALPTGTNLTVRTLAPTFGIWNTSSNWTFTTRSTAWNGEIYNMFDNSNSTVASEGRLWHSNNDAASWPHFIQIQSPVNVSLNRFSWRTTTSSVNGDPGTFGMKGSTNGSTFTQMTNYTPVIPFGINNQNGLTNHVLFLNYSTQYFPYLRLDMSSVINSGTSIATTWGSGGSFAKCSEMKLFFNINYIHLPFDDTSANQSLTNLTSTGDIANVRNAASLTSLASDTNATPTYSRIIPSAFTYTGAKSLFLGDTLVFRIRCDIGDMSGNSILNSINGVYYDTSNSPTINTTDFKVGNGSLNISRTTLSHVSIRGVDFTGTAGHTFCCWVKTDVANSYMVLVVFSATDTFTSSNFLGFGNGQNTNGFYEHNNGVATFSGTSVSYVNNQWYHIAWVFGNITTRKIYVNGVLTYTYTGNAFAQNCTGTASRIGNGAWDNNTSINGQVDDVRLYSRILTDAEVLAIYNQTL